MELALYGNEKIRRIYCNDCERWALVLDNIRQCCDFPVPESEEVTKLHRIVEPEFTRRTPPIAVQKDILRRQLNCCLYCSKRLGAAVWYKGRRIILRCNWDHVVPFDYARDNDLVNFVAACHVCNNWKSRMVFNSLEEIQVYVTEKWERVGTDVGKALRGMRETIPE